MISWDERYSEEGYVYGTEPNLFLEKVVGKIPQHAKVLCLADGEGRNSVYLAEQGFDVTAVDQSAVGMAKATRLATERGVELKTVVADLADYPIIPESWDAIVSIFCHLPPVIREPLHSDLVTGLVTNGVIILEAYTPEQITLGTGGPPVPELTMTLKSLEQELEGLDFEHAIELEREVVEGKYHTGRGAVVQLLARKP